MIHEVDGAFCISSHRCWLPGVYATREAARFAFQFADADLRRLQEELNSRHADASQRVITTEMLKQLATSPAPTE